MTDALRAQIFGLNATRPYGIDVDEVLQRARHDVIERRRSAYRESPDPHFLTFGPRTRRAFLANLRARGGSPVSELALTSATDDARLKQAVTRRTHGL